MSITNQAKQQDVSKDIFSFKSNNMQFFRADGMKEATGYGEPKDWYAIVTKELLDNPIDWLRDNYRGSMDNLITATFVINKAHTELNCKIRNSNPKNIPIRAFTLLPHILNYNQTFGSKQNEFRATRGQLGDGLKRIIGLPFILQNLGDDKSVFFNKQWKKPMYFRANGVERQVTVNVNLGRSEAINNIVESPNRLSHTDTEVELTLPIIESVRDDVTAFKITQQYRLNTIATTDISFNIRVIDEKAKADDYTRASDTTIALKAQHPVPKNLHNSTSVLIYHPVEFVSRFESVHDRDNESVYDVIRKFKEGAQIPKSKFDRLLGVQDVDKLSIGAFLNSPNYQKKMLELYNLLLDEAKQRPIGAEKISLPFPLKDRHKHLAQRLYDMHPFDYLEQNDENIYYTIQYGHTKKTPVILFAFELLAVPLNIESLRKDPSYKKSEFYGLVNSSYAALGTRFDGSYGWLNKKGRYVMAFDIEGALQQFGFVFSAQYRNSKNKIPCIFIGNLISQRVDYTEKSKAKMDTSPFIPTILAAVRKLAQ